MGVRLNWLAVEGADKASLLERLGFVECGTASDEFSSALACAVFPNGWLVLVSEGMGLDLDQALPLVSADGLALGGEAEEHVMFSGLRAFRDGAQVWTVTHDPDDLNGVTVEGEPPAQFADIRATLAARQAEDDGMVDHMFELPIRLGQALCGYAYAVLHPVVWMILERPGRGRAAYAPARLPHSFTTELAPRLKTSGWTFAAQDPNFRGRAWDVTRMVGGRRHVLSFRWKEHGPDLQFETSFVVLDGAEPHDKVLLTGEIRPVRAAGQAPDSPFWRRLADRLRSRAAASPQEAKPAPADPLDLLVARVKEDLTAIEAFLASGEPSPRIRLNSGSADVLRPTSA